MTVDPSLERLKERGWREVAAINQALAEGQIDEDGWHEAMASLIRPAYLAADNPYAQAGHGGNAETWKATRGFVAQALHRSGTFLDAGCASGILMESVQQWGAEKELQIDPYGLDIVPELADLARQRLPQWADRIYVGNIRNWQPPNEPFDFVLIRPEYAPNNRVAEMVAHVLNLVLKPQGRLILNAGSEEVESSGVDSPSVDSPSVDSRNIKSPTVEARLADGGYTVSGRVEIPHEKDSRLVRRLFWIDKE